MCLILLAVNGRSDYPLVIAANRDEFYERPSRPLAWWPESPGLLAGRDEHGGGTWLGITRRGRWAAVTNYREVMPPRPDAASRGGLVSDFLRGDDPPAAYLDHVMDRAGGYNGFNLLAGIGTEVWYASNRGGPPQRLTDGVHGLSNHRLNTPWPKVTRGRARMRDILSRPGPPDEAALWALLADRRRPPDPELPDTGVGLDRERELAPLFISGAQYGTRSSSLLWLSTAGHVTLIERTFRSVASPPPIEQTRRYEFCVG
ncbi:MAG: NRDE family protein [Acidobacteria bacterium]|nr:NRDE family protein [Acidobacteriota bacterium]